MKRKVYCVYILLLVVTFSQCHSRNRTLHKKLVEMSQEVNQSAPVMLDTYTRFDGASVTKDNIFQYCYTVLKSSDSDSLLGTRAHEIRQSMIREFSSNPQLGIFKMNRVSVAYCYLDEKGDTIQTLWIHPEDYQ